MTLQCHWAEGHMADDRAVMLGDQRNAQAAGGPKCVDQLPLAGCGKGGVVDLPDGGDVGGACGADRGLVDIWQCCVRDAGE